MRAYLSVLTLLAVPLFASGGAVASGCVDQGPLVACPALNAAASGGAAAASVNGNVCLQDVGCVDARADAACNTSVGDATTGDVGAEHGCVVLGSACVGEADGADCLPPPPPPANCPPGSVFAGYYIIIQTSSGPQVEPVCWFY